MVRQAVKAIVDILRLHRDVLGWYWMYRDGARYASVEHFNRGREFKSIMRTRVPSKILGEIKNLSIEELGDRDIRMVIWESGSIKLDGICGKLEIMEGVEHLSIHGAIEGEGGYRYLEFMIPSDNKETHGAFLREINRL